MKPTLYLLLLVISVVLFGCKKETCRVDCTDGGINFAAIGFTDSELNNSVMLVEGLYDTLDYKHWRHLHNDSANDTMICGATTVNQSSVEPLEIIFPSTNEDYLIENIVVNGVISEQLPCHEGGHIAGDPVGPGCNSNPYLYQYTINGTDVKLPAKSDPDEVGYIYIVK